MWKATQRKQRGNRYDEKLSFSKKYIIFVALGHIKPLNKDSHLFNIQILQ